jgi:hypothetical protein
MRWHEVMQLELTSKCAGQLLAGMARSFCDDGYNVAL